MHLLGFTTEHNCYRLIICLYIIYQKICCFSILRIANSTHIFYKIILRLILTQCKVLIPFGIGIVIGIFLIAKLIEFIFSKAEIHAYYAIIGLIIASPIAILLKTDWSAFSVVTLLIGVVTFAAGWFAAS